VIVDGARAFVGGINYSADHLADFGPLAKQDYAVELQGPVVSEIHRFATSAIRAQDNDDGRPGQGSDDDRPWRGSGESTSPTVGDVAALFVTRDNLEHRNDIERHYRAAIRSARKSVLIANAYFFPGYLLLRQLRRAARRGVQVRLILQGEPDMPIAKTAASLLYGHLQRAGVEIHEYCKRPLHGKVAVVDDDWSTIGSSNLDPLSLSLNLEANVVLRDAEFAATLRTRLEHLIATECKRVVPLRTSRWAWWEDLSSTVLFHVLRRFPVWASRLPTHVPKLHLATPESACRPQPEPQGDAR